MGFFSGFLDFLKNRERLAVVAFVGKSGTGKSYHASEVAAKCGADLVIDDGILIKAGKILAGYSAKRTNSYMAAVRAAIFDEKSHRDKVAGCLEKMRKNGCRKLLIVATSEKMAKKIAARLHISSPSRFIHIEDVATDEEIKTATLLREEEGRHALPVNAAEVERRYSSIFRSIFSRKGDLMDKAIVQPVFSRQAGKQSRLTLDECSIGVRKAVADFDSRIHVDKIVLRPSRSKVVVWLEIPSVLQADGRINLLEGLIGDDLEKHGIILKKIDIVRKWVCPCKL